MTPAKRLRRAIGYEINVPRCENCKYHQMPTIRRQIGRYATIGSWCKQFKLTVAMTAICDHWRSKTGVPLEDAPTGIPTLDEHGHIQMQGQEK